VVFQLHRRASVRPVPADAGRSASLDFYRRELERQREALRGIWSWYLLPMAPALVSVIVMRAIDQGGIDNWVVWYGVGLVLLSAGVWGLNRRAARKLDRRIQELRDESL
jgi:hypothetical protein